jgi:hypothetical protein
MAKRRRKAEIREDLQPAVDPVFLNAVAASHGFLNAVAASHGFPPRVFSPGGGLLHFHGTAIITGDGLYRGYNNKGELKHCIVTNPGAFARQESYFVAHGRR